MAVTREQLAGWEKLDPGVYVDETGAMHLIADELLEAHGFAATPENIAQLEETLRVVASAYGVETVETLEDP